MAHYTLLNDSRLSVVLEGAADFRAVVTSRNFLLTSAPRYQSLARRLLRATIIYPSGQVAKWRTTRLVQFPRYACTPEDFRYVYTRMYGSDRTNPASFRNYDDWRAITFLLRDVDGLLGLDDCVRKSFVPFLSFTLLQ